MKRIQLCFLFLFLAGFLWAQQDSIKNVMITEWRGDTWNTAYYEISNMDDDTVDLSNVYVAAIPVPNNFITREEPYGYTYTVASTNFPGDHGTRLWGKLAPGQSVVIKTMLDAADNDGNTQNLQRFLEVNAIYSYEMEAHRGDFDYPYHPELQMWGFDSVSPNYHALTRLWKSYATCLWYCMENGDSIIVDQVLAQTNWPSSLPVDVAGVDDATGTSVLVRKYKVKQGTQDWASACGVDYEDSEWIVIPFYQGRLVYTTVGNHGDYHIDLQSTTVEISTADTTMLSPWGIYKGDSIIHEFEFGDGMAWYFIEDPLSVEDSAHVIVQTGDILNIFACGNELEHHSYKITVREPGDNEARVFPVRKRFVPDPETDPYGYWSTLYYVTENQPGIDTIGNVPFAERVDTLFKYLEKAPDAGWEIVWVDGHARVDLMYGDILKVTAENGTTTKEFFIDVQDYAGSSNAQLGAITWPDYPGYIEDWMGDTIPTFSSSKLNYNLHLPYGTISVPALTAIPYDPNANIVVNRATSLRGSAAERTTTFTVTADDDSTVLVYAITFEVDKDPERTQYYMGEPFISEILGQENNNAFFLEIVNPRGVELDMSQYLFVTTGTSLKNPALAVADLPPVIGTPIKTSWLNRYGKAYVPGYKFSGDTSIWAQVPLKLYFDAAVDPMVKPGDVFVMHQSHLKENRLSPFIGEADVVISGAYPNPWNEEHNWQDLLTQLRGKPTQVLYMFKILNDSIFDGTKELGDINDLLLIDEFGSPVDDGTYIGGSLLDTKIQTAFSLRRRPYVYEGTPELGGGFGTSPEDTDWDLTYSYSPGFSQANISQFVGSHVMDVITIHMSTVASSIYLVDDGFEGDLVIQGDMTATNVEQFFGNLSKANPEQHLTVISGTSGAEKGLSDPVSTNDTLVVVSANMKCTTRYTLLNQPLDDNAVLTPVNTPSKLTIEIEGNQGVIRGIAYGDLLKNWLDSLDLPDLATWSVINQNGELVPLKFLNFDTVLVNTRIGDSIYIEVIAQNGATKITYKFEPAALSSDAFVISSAYGVDQEARIISGVLYGTSVPAFWKYVEPVKGAEAVVTDKAGFDRNIGTMGLDDKVKVVSQDGTRTVIYYINFLDEDVPDYNLQPEVTVAFADTSIKTNAPVINVSATVTDDNMPYPSVLTYKWEVISGVAGNVTIASDDALSTDVTFSSTGNYVLRFTAHDGELSDFDEVSVSVSSPDNQPPVLGVVFADSTIDRGSTITLVATATDDGYPDPPAALTYTWSVFSGNAADVTISTPDQLTTNVTISKLGTYVIQISVSDGEVSVTAKVTITTEIGEGIEDLQTGFRMYPNPARDKVTFELGESLPARSNLRIYNITGGLTGNYQMEQGISSCQIDISGYNPGLYYLQLIQDGKSIITLKLTVR